MNKDHSTATEALGGYGTPGLYAKTGVGTVTAEGKAECTEVVTEDGLRATTQATIV
ncbi:hypothetical protein [Rhodalgimonas zhirmunskyi]|uniref:Uncharacterized protein n=1 Tax=Rhodalgimonas zhirmunskyi TaxID=2964767 RepID=A0AAJ1UB62_9RHOB|nr:hypothetical protein [Rhodoalgimonas zhirmunskyi]MDQ2093341.1 hypothetical protein [Rhodoalgimonas zhirmunskyi]